MKTKNFIVPHDFTNVSNIALDHAIATAKPINAEIFLLHVVGKNKDINAAEKKLANVISNYTTSVKITPSVRVGNIFEDIGDFAAEHHSELIFMGTHGAHGWQHLTGMNALKVITHSSVPFIIVQETTPKETGYDDIVLPLDLNKETKQKLAIVATIAKYFKSNVHVIIPEEKDEFLSHKVKANVQFAKKFLEERNITITITIVSSSGFDNEVIRHAVSIDADLIAIMNLNKGNILGVLSANHEEFVITNDAKIPVMIMNPIEGITNLSVDFNG
ncbi:MAG: universal stress protein [Flavobacteriales bacterium]|tara:strand:- start:700 stop:1521 length:822 start_codon:yes stop_codon:yes gene_type:complete